MGGRCKTAMYICRVSRIPARLGEGGRGGPGLPTGLDRATARVLRSGRGFRWTGDIQPHQQGNDQRRGRNLILRLERHECSARATHVSVTTRGEANPARYAVPAQGQAQHITCLSNASTGRGDASGALERLADRRTSNRTPVCTRPHSHPRCAWQYRRARSVCTPHACTAPLGDSTLAASQDRLCPPKAKALSLAEVPMAWRRGVNIVRLQTSVDM